MSKKLLVTKDDECIGCRNIANASFPFYAGWVDTLEGKAVIDVEGCGETQEEGKGYLLIFFCPVCGRDLYN